jgi:hypothetical protein
MCETKRKAFEAMDAHGPFWVYYKRVPSQGGVQRPRNSERKVTLGEAYHRVFRLVTENLV